MNKCVVCGTNIAGWEAKLGGTCDDCHISKSKHKNEAESSLTEPKTGTPEVLVTATPAATTFTTIAWLFVGLGLICTVTSALLFAEEGQAFLAAIVFISGCFGAVLLGLLAEISSNLAKLVNNSR